MVVIAIDGPSGSGKSSVARAVAERLGLAYLDTGAMYRAATLWAGSEVADLRDQIAVTSAVGDMPLELTTDPRHPTFTLDGEDITAEIRSEAVSELVSQVATNLDVRAELKRRQQAIIAEANASGPGIVAEGRDITTVVAPDADVRILLTASPGVRLARRAWELHRSADAEALSATRDQVFRRDDDDATVSQFLSAADGVSTIDSSDLTLEQTIQAALSVVQAKVGLEPEPASVEKGTGVHQQEENQLPADETARENALRAGLDDYELSDEDRALIDLDWDGYEEPEAEKPLPVLAIVGRPNVGKSTLVNRILGRREAVVEDTPGVTRDRVTYTAEWAGRDFNLVDTGGWEVDVAGIDAKVAEQAEIAILLADAVIFVVDATVGATDTDERVVRLLRKSGKPVVLAANKVDGPKAEADAAALWSLGLGEPHPISALHGRGTGDLLDAAMEVLPTESEVGELRPFGPRRVALVGRPNVGKSSLLNKLAGENRVVVHEVAGTTRDPVDELIEIKGQPYWFVDTAGIRRRVHQTQGADFYASLRTAAAIDKAELGLVLLDASQELTEQDIRVIQQVVDAGRALVIVLNKWDLMDEDRRHYLERELTRQLERITWAPRVNLSAKTGWHVDKLEKAIETALDSWDTRIPTGRLNAFLGELVAAHPHPVRGGKQPRILFVTQASTRPPRFVIFTTGFLDPQYRRFIERRLRETFGFEGSPIEIGVRVRERRKR
ncbi:MAG: bifunctional cytidylate kinase/GTPase Der [Promicromonosporaceae bacterium]|nr:bifunctional cytidylate kinase/GTPase Der [Promicromonosporaceae bacterium]